MQADNNTLVEELLALTAVCTAKVQQFKGLPEEQLNHKEDADRWSILECIEHLNRYGDYYLPEIQKAILSGKAGSAQSIFKSGLIGNYFANLMRVKNGKITKMKTPADKNPAGSQLTAITLDRFLKQQEMLTSLLEQARNTDLTATKVPISLSRFIRLRLGDTFRFFVYHVERHVVQASLIQNLRFKI